MDTIQEIDRYEYLDATRGLAIWTVIYCHISGFCMDKHTPSSVMIFLTSFFIPAFFFISGFLIKEFDKVPNVLYIIKEIKKKTLQLFVPTLCFIIIWGISHDITIKHMIFDNMKVGYWFTLALFEMYVVIYLLLLLLKMCNLSKLIYKICLVIGTLSAILIFHYLDHNTNLGQNYGPIWSRITGFMATLNSIPLFLMGVLSKEYKPYFVNIISAKGINKYIIFTVFACLIFNYFYTLPIKIVCFFHVIIVLAIIYNLFQKKNIFGFYDLTNHILKFISFIGKNTLEIYFLHYFLIFNLPTSFSNYLNFAANASRHSVVIPELLIIGILTTLISLLAILWANILKQIPFVSEIAFGKYNKHALKS